MSRPSNREKILTEGLRVVHERGFADASVRDIVQAAGVPQGLVHQPLHLERGLRPRDHRSLSGQRPRDTIVADACATMRCRRSQRLRAYIDGAKNRLDRDGMRNGCLFGNFAAEACDHSEVIRHRLVEIFAEVQQAVAYCLRAAVKAGELPPRFRMRRGRGLRGLVAAGRQASCQGASAVRLRSSASSRFCSRRCCVDAPALTLGRRLQCHAAVTAHPRPLTAGFRS